MGTYYFSTHGTDRSGVLLALEVEGTVACAAACAAALRAAISKKDDAIFFFFFVAVAVCNCCGYVE